MFRLAFRLAIELGNGLRNDIQCEHALVVGGVVVPVTQGDLVGCTRFQDEVVDVSGKGDVGHLDAVGQNQSVVRSFSTVDRVLPIPASEEDAVRAVAGVDDVIHRAADDDLVLRGVGDGVVVMLVIIMLIVMMLVVMMLVVIMLVIAMLILIVLASTEGEDLRDAGAGLVGGGEQDIVAVRTFCLAAEGAGGGIEAEPFR